MADHTATVKNVAPGLNDVGAHRMYTLEFVGSTLNNDQLLGTISAEIGESGMPAVEVGGSWSGTIGARVFTAAEFVVVSFDEATGILTLKNTSGGTVTNAKVLVCFRSSMVATPA